MTESASARLMLKQRHAKPAYMRHPWVFASAIASTDGHCSNGDLVSVHDHRGRFIAYGLLSDSSEIRVRLLSWNEKETFDDSFWADRIRRAVSFRTDALRLQDLSDALRLVNSEGDLLPGLLVDRYHNLLVVQFTTFPMARRSDILIPLLIETLKPEGVYEKPDAGAQKLEGFSRPAAVLAGSVPDSDIEVREGRARFLVSLAHGHKTGFYLDQRDNRLRVGSLTAGLRVLDCFTYTGAFAVHAALGGAAEVLAVESSAPALEAAERHVALNGLKNVSLRRGDVFETMRLLREEGTRFDMVILDPPKLARSRHGLDRALAGYKDINLSAMKLLNPGGWLVTCSCSGLVALHDFIGAVNSASVDAGRVVRLAHVGGQAPDHAVIASFQDGTYLKCLFARID